MIIDDIKDAIAFKRGAKLALKKICKVTNEIFDEEPMKDSSYWLGFVVPRSYGEENINKYIMHEKKFPSIYLIDDGSLPIALYEVEIHKDGTGIGYGKYKTNEGSRGKLKNIIFEQDEITGLYVYLINSLYGEHTYNIPEGNKLVEIGWATTNEGLMPTTASVFDIATSKEFSGLGEDFDDDFPMDEELLDERKAEKSIRGEKNAEGEKRKRFYNADSRDEKFKDETRIVTFELPVADYNRLKEKANTKQVSVSAILRDYVSDHIGVM